MNKLLYFNNKALKPGTEFTLYLKPNVYSMKGEVIMALIFTKNDWYFSDGLNEIPFNDIKDKSKIGAWYIKD